MLCMPYTVNMYVRVSNMCARVEHVGHARCIKFDVLLFYSSANIYISSCSSQGKGGTETFATPSLQEARVPGVDNNKKR
jgi:hypothetical protein